MSSRFQIPGLEQFPDLQRQMEYELKKLEQKSNCGDCEQANVIVNKYRQRMAEVKNIQAAPVTSQPPSRRFS